MPVPPFEHINRTVEPGESDTPNDVVGPGVRWLHSAGVKDISPFGARVAELLDDWLLGIYHYHGAAALDWSNPDWMEIRYGTSMSTYDDRSLTRLVFLAHDLALRVEISPHSHWNVMLRIHPYRHHPTLDQAFAAWKARRQP